MTFLKPRLREMSSTFSAIDCTAGRREGVKQKSQLRNQFLNPAMTSVGGLEQLRCLPKVLLRVLRVWSECR